MIVFSIIHEFGRLHDNNFNAYNTFVNTEEPENFDWNSCLNSLVEGLLKRCIVIQAQHLNHLIRILEMDESNFWDV